MSALCKVVAPAQVQVTYSDSHPLPFRVEWSGELGPISFAGSTPDEAADRALSVLFGSRSDPSTATRGRLLLPELCLPSPAKLGSRADPPASTKTLVRATDFGSRAEPTPSTPSAAVSEPLAQAGWVEAMHERIQAIEEGKPVRRANLRLVR